MRKRDLFALCFQNLFRRKSRTMLTVLGVVIGCCAIIIMVSIGIGSREAQDKMLSEMGDLTVINVYYYNYGSQDTTGALTDTALDSFRAIPGVEVVTPKYNPYEIPFTIHAGAGNRYQLSWANIFGMADGAPEALGYELLEGDFPTEDDVFPVLVGEKLAYDFMDTKRPDGYNMIYWWETATWDEETGTYTNLPEPYFDPYGAQLEIQLDVGEGKKPIKQKLEVVGVMKEDYSRGWETSEGIVMRLDDLLLLRDQYRRATGYKSDKEDTYEDVTVKVKSIDLVSEVEDSIQEAGFNTSSMESIREPMEEEARQQQAILGGLGAISLLVAAIGITNTMIMSISERTREIGIMKALGCRVRDLRTQFLAEAGVIGISGGVLGVIISFIISIVMNLVSSGIHIDSLRTAWTILTEKGSRMSVIPVWLAAFGLVFSTLIGLVSGYYPARKAVKISALEAIRHE